MGILTGEAGKPRVEEYHYCEECVTALQIALKTAKRNIKKKWQFTRM
jgi:hypothetical protein